MPVFKKKPIKRHPRATARNAAPTLLGIWKKSLLALPIALGGGILTLLPSAALLLKLPDPGRYAGAVGGALLCLCAALYGVLTVRLTRGGSPLLCGLSSGVTLLALLGILSAAVPSGTDAQSRPVTLFLYGLAPLLTVCGALLRPKPHSRRKKHR